MLFKTKQKEICKTINTYFLRPNFLEEICNYSNNNYEQVISNISRIINYYIVTNDQTLDYSIEELLMKANSVTTNQTEFLVYPSNSVYLNQLRFQGINPYYNTNNVSRISIDTLDASISAYPLMYNPFYSPIYQNIKEAIIESFTKPDTIYKSILKQPKGKELPIVLGNDEKHYYSSILELRIKNAEDTLKDTCANIGKKVINKIIGQDSLLVLFPSSSRRYSISDKDIEDKTTGLYIPPQYLSFIRIPSKYKIITQCAINKKLCPGELLDYNTGATYTTPSPTVLSYPLIIYSRYERVSVTNEFEYANLEFTGDIEYDIDLIYGQLDSNKSRQALRNKVGTNIESMKMRDDITVRKSKEGKYEIRNGRHRILYLKKFYTFNYNEYKKDNRLQELKRYVTIPMNVESTITDELTNEYVLKLYQLDFTTAFYKSNINNDEPQLIIVIKDRAYYISNNQEIINLYNYLLNGELYNPYYIGKNDNTRNKEYQKLFEYLILELREKIYTMELIDIIRYLKEEGIHVNGRNHKLDTINYYVFFLAYNDIQHTLQRNKVFNQKHDIVKRTERNLLLHKLGKIIMKILNENKELLSIPWENLYETLQIYPELSLYDKETLEEAANLAGYQKIRLEYLFKDTEYTKMPKIW